MTRDELIAALEGAPGPSRELDRLIHFTFVHPWLAQKCVKWVVAAFEEDGSFIWWDAEQLEKKKEGFSDQWMPYTASIDAALTLVPDCLWRSILHAPNIGKATVSLRTGGLTDPATKEWMGYGATPAIALCIAALKARPE